MRYTVQAKPTTGVRIERPLDQWRPLGSSYTEQPPGGVQATRDRNWSQDRKTSRPVEISRQQLYRAATWRSAGYTRPQLESGSSQPVETSRQQLYRAATWRSAGYTRPQLESGSKDLSTSGESRRKTGREVWKRGTGGKRWREEEAARKQEEVARRELEETLERERLELQRLMEERRMKHEKEMREMQFQHDKEKHARSDKRKLADKVAKWEVSDQPEAYLQRFGRKQESPRKNGLSDCVPFCQVRR